MDDRRATNKEHTFGDGREPVSAPRQPSTNSYEWARRVGTLLSIPLTLGLSPVVGCAIGWALDRLFHTRPIFILAGILCGFAAGIRETWVLIRRTSQEEKRKD